MPGKRVRHYLELAGMTVLLSLFFIWKSGPSADKVLGCLVIDAVFLAVFLYLLESSRSRKLLGNSMSSNYGKITKCYGVICIVAACFYFFPAFTVPAASFALFLCLVSNAEIAIACSMLLCLLLCSATGGRFYELAACCILAFTGAQMAKTMHERLYRRWGCLILFSVSVCIPELFYYLAYEGYSVRLLLWNMGFGVLSVILYAAAADRLYDQADHEEQDAYEAIIKEDYPLVKDIKSYSKAEYIHAIKTATIAGKCAAEIGANEMAAAAAGFYYRLGVLEGEPFIENGVRLAQENCFPALVVEILSEYNGELRLPSTKESAIVHMVDTCIKRIEMLNSQNLSSSWNQDMVIYQTLNEVSSTGIYDRSGVSMNQFLKIRELMVREEIGYDSKH